MPGGSPLSGQKAEAMQRSVATTAQRKLPDLTANSTLSSLMSGNAAPTSPPPSRGPGGFEAPTPLSPHPFSDSTTPPPNGRRGGGGAALTITRQRQTDSGRSPDGQVMGLPPPPPTRAQPKCKSPAPPPPRPPPWQWPTPSGTGGGGTRDTAPRRPPPPQCPCGCGGQRTADAASPGTTPPDGP